MGTQRNSYGKVIKIKLLKLGYKKNQAKKREVLKVEQKRFESFLKAKIILQ